MEKHCFIDESGTMSDQKIMTVALVALDGVRTAEKLHPRLVKAIFPPPKVRGLKELERWYESQTLHFSEMDSRQKIALGAELSKSNIQVFVGFCRHIEENSTHEHRFTMYRELLKLTINMAFEKIDSLIVSVSKQGGWESYGPDLLREHRALPLSFVDKGDYRKGEFFLSSPSKQGQQIADFYASASWNYLLANGEGDRGAPYARIKNQVMHFEELIIPRSS